MEFTGRAPVTINGRVVPGSLQLPERWLKPGRNRVVSGDCRSDGPVLVSPTVWLLDVGAGGYEIEVYGKNVLTFRGGTAFAIMDARQRPVKVAVKRTGQHAWLSFAGRGRFVVRIAD